MIVEKTTQNNAVCTRSVSNNKRRSDTTQSGNIERKLKVKATGRWTHKKRRMPNKKTLRVHI